MKILKIKLLTQGEKDVPKSATISSGVKFLSPKATILCVTGPNGFGNLTSWASEISPSFRPVSTKYSGPPPCLEREIHKKIK